MPGGLFSRLKVWVYQDAVYSADLNGEVDNIISHMMPIYLDSYSHSVGEMQTQNSPGSVGSEILPTSTAGEIAALRYQIAQIIGATSGLWYDAIPESLKTLTSTVGQLSTSSPNRIISGAVSASGQPMFLLPAGASNGLKCTLKASGTPLVVLINGSQFSFNSDINLTGLTAAPSTNNTAALGTDSTGTSFSSATPQTAVMGEYMCGSIDMQSSNLLQYQGSLPLGSVASNFLTFNDKMVAFKIGSEYSIGFLEKTATSLARCLRGYFFDSTGTWIPRAACSTADTVTILQIGYIFLRSGGTLNATYNQPKVGPVAPSSPSSGDYWYDTVNQTWKIYSSGAFVVDSSLFIGTVCSTSADCVGARSSDFSGSYSSLCDLNLNRVVDSTNLIRSTNFGGRVSSYGGTPLYFEGASAQWDITANLDTGVTGANGTPMFIYLDKNGTPILSDVSPHYRDDLLGLYHPAKPYRCVGVSQVGGTGNIFALQCKSFKGFPIDHRASPKFFQSSSISIATNASVLAIGSKMAFVSKGRPILVSNEPQMNGGTVGTQTASISVTSSGAGTVKVSLFLQITDAAGVTDPVLGAVPLCSVSIVFGSATTTEQSINQVSQVIDALEGLSIALTGQCSAQITATVSGPASSITLKNFGAVRFQEL